MVSPFVKAYVYIDAWKHNKKMDGVSDILIRELSSFDYYKGKIRYDWFWSAGVHVPNASATIPSLILINAEWASRIVLNRDNPYMHNAFALTVCYEITHQEKDYNERVIVCADVIKLVSMLLTLSILLVILYVLKIDVFMYAKKLRLFSK